MWSFAWYGMPRGGGWKRHSAAQAPGACAHEQSDVLTSAASASPPGGCSGRRTCIVRRGCDTALRRPAAAVSVAAPLLRTNALRAPERRTGGASGAAARMHAPTRAVAVDVVGRRARASRPATAAQLPRAVSILPSAVRAWGVYESHLPRPPRASVTCDRMRRIQRTKLPTTRLPAEQRAGGRPASCRNARHGAGPASRRTHVLTRAPMTPHRAPRHAWRSLAVTPRSSHESATPAQTTGALG